MFFFFHFILTVGKKFYSLNLFAVYNDTKYVLAFVDILFTYSIKFKGLSLINIFSCYFFYYLPISYLWIYNVFKFWYCPESRLSIIFQLVAYCKWRKDFPHLQEALSYFVISCPSEHLDALVPNCFAVFSQIHTHDNEADHLCVPAGSYSENRGPGTRCLHCEWNEQSSRFVSDF